MPDLVKLRADAGTGTRTISKTTSLKKGASGSAVTALQKQLIALGYLKTGTADGNFGPLTDAAVRSFQKASGLAVDGSYGSLSVAAMAKATAPKTAPTPAPTPPPPPPAPITTAPPAIVKPQAVATRGYADTGTSQVAPATVARPAGQTVTIQPPAPAPVAPVVAPPRAMAPPPYVAPAPTVVPTPPAPTPNVSTVHQTSAGRLAGGGGIAMPPIPGSAYQPQQQPYAGGGNAPVLGSLPLPGSAPPVAPQTSTAGSTIYQPQQNPYAGGGNAPVLTSVQPPAPNVVQPPVLDTSGGTNAGTNTGTGSGGANYGGTSGQVIGGGVSAEQQLSVAQPITAPATDGTQTTSSGDTTTAIEPIQNAYFDSLTGMSFSYDASTDPDYLRQSAALENQIAQAMIGRGGLYSSVKDMAVMSGLMGMMLDFENKAYEQFKGDRDWMLNMARFEQDRIDTAWTQNMQERTFAADRADTAWDQGFKVNQFNADRADTAWEQNFKITQYNATRADEMWNRSYQTRQAAAASANKSYTDKEAEVVGELSQYATAITGLRSQYTNSKTTMDTLLTQWTKTGKPSAEAQQFFGVSADATLLSGYSKILAKKNELSGMNTYINQLQTEYDAGKNAVGSVREAIDAAKPQANDNFTATELEAAFAQESQRFTAAFKSMTRAEMLATIANLQGKNAAEYVFKLGSANYNKLVAMLKAKVPYAKSAVKMPVSSAK